MENILIDNAKVMAKGQITLPKDIREALGVRTGDRVALIRQNDQVIMMNAAVYGMKMLQTAMKGEAEKAGIASDEDVSAMIAAMRAKDDEYSGLSSRLESCVIKARRPAGSFSQKMCRKGEATQSTRDYK